MFINMFSVIAMSIFCFSIIFEIWYLKKIAIHAIILRVHIPMCFHANMILVGKFDIFYYFRLRY